MHVHIDMLLILLPEAPRRAVTLAGDAIVIVFLAIGFVLAAEFSIDSWDSPTSVLRLPLSIVYGSVVVGFACLLWRYAAVVRVHYRDRVSE